MILIKYEFSKIKRIRGLHLVYVLPLLMSIISFFEISKKISQAVPGQVIWPISTIYVQFYVIFSPIVIVLILFSLIQIENRNKMWESNFLLPIGKGEIYIGKTLIGVILVIAYCLISYLSYVGSILLCHTFYSELLVLNQQDHMIMINFFSRMLLSFILYTLIAIPIFIYVESPITALGTFLFCIFLSVFLDKRPWFIYYPFSYHVIVFKTYRSAYDVFSDKGFWLTIGYAVSAFFGGKFLFTKVRQGNLNS